MIDVFIVVLVGKRCSSNDFSSKYFMAMAAISIVQKAKVNSFTQKLQSPSY